MTPNELVSFNEAIEILVDASPFRDQFLKSKGKTGRQRSTPFPRRVDTRIALFEACSTFARAPACMLAESPDAALLAKVLQSMSLLP